MSRHVLFLKTDNVIVKCFGVCDFSLICHPSLTFTTGGLWLIVLLVKYLLKTA